MRITAFVVVAALALTLPGCANRVAHLSTADVDPTRLAPQESDGMRAEATLHDAPASSGRAVVLDLRLVNTASVTRRNVTVARITLGTLANDARPGPSATLHGRGSTVDYPGVGRWRVPTDVNGEQQLDVEVRYEIQAQPSVAHFRWMVRAGAFPRGDDTH